MTVPEKQVTFTGQIAIFTQVSLRACCDSRISANQIWPKRERWIDTVAGKPTKS